MIAENEYKMRRKENSRAKLCRVVAIFILLGLGLSVVTYFGTKVQAGNSAYISGESEWSKAQKEASINLLQYVRTEDERYYNSYLRSLDVISGDRAGREELTSSVPDFEKVRRGFIKGNNHPEDVNAMIWLFQNFKNQEQIQNAHSIWEKADAIVDESIMLADEIHRSVNEGTLSEIEKEDYSNRIITINRQLTAAGQDFSEAMSSSARMFGSYIFRLNVLLSTIFILFAAYYSVSYMRHLRGANAKLGRSEYKFRNVLDHSRDVIYQIGIGSSRYEYMSSSVKEMLGFEPDEVMEGGPGMILNRTHPDDLERMKKRQEQNESAVVEEAIVQDSEFRIKRKDGTYIWVNNKRSVVHDDDGNPVAIVGNVRDISVHKHQMEKLDQSLKEKQTLLAEIHHRVKNNLAIVSSLIELQKDEVAPQLKSAFSNVQSRIKSIALIHEKLYENTIFSEVELADYLHELSDMISHTYHSKSNRVSIELNLDDIKVDMMCAVPVGLICNELINNCFKHAFKECCEGIVTIDLKDLGSHVEVTVADNGDGLPDDFSLDSVQGLGVTLLTALTEQINGQLRSASRDGSQFVLTFPVHKNKNKKAERKAV